MESVGDHTAAPFDIICRAKFDSLPAVATRRQLRRPKETCWKLASPLLTVHYYVRSQMLSLINCATARKRDIANKPGRKFLSYNWERRRVELVKLVFHVAERLVKLYRVFYKYCRHGVSIYVQSQFDWSSVFCKRSKRTTAMSVILYKNFIDIIFDYVN